MKRILVAEDHEPSRELVREILEGHGYRVTEARDGREALQRIQESAPDLVLMDIQLPLLNGFAVLSQLRQDPRFAALPVVAVTAFAMRGDRERALTAGFNAYLTKPIDSTLLREQIKELLG